MSARPWRERVAVKVAIDLILGDDKEAVEAFVYTSPIGMFPSTRRVLLRLLEAAK